MPQIHHYSLPPVNDTRSHLHKFSVRVSVNQYLQTLQIFARGCTDSRSMSFNSSSLKWVPLVQWTVQGVWSSKVVSNLNKSRMFCVVISVSLMTSVLFMLSANIVKVEYVTCKTCKSPDTLLTKENRIFFMSCESCGSRRSVNAIKSGFQAQVGRRKATAQ